MLKSKKGNSRRDNGKSFRRKKASAQDFVATTANAKGNLLARKSCVPGGLARASTVRRKPAHDHGEEDEIEEPAPLLTRDSSFLERPDGGWLHDEFALTYGEGVYYSFPVIYLGKIRLSKSLRSVEFPIRCVIVQEAIHRIRELGHSRPARENHVVHEDAQRFLASNQPDLERAEVDINISTDGLVTCLVDEDGILANHEMTCISYAGGGEHEDYDIVAYVAKCGGIRECFVFDCGEVSNQVLSTIGQAFVAAGDKQEAELPDEILEYLEGYETDNQEWDDEGLTNEGSESSYDSGMPSSSRGFVGGIARGGGGRRRDSEATITGEDDDVVYAEGDYNNVDDEPLYDTTEGIFDDGDDELEDDEDMYQVVGGDNGPEDYRSGGAPIGRLPTYATANNRGKPLGRNPTYATGDNKDGIYDSTPTYDSRNPTYATGDNKDGIYDSTPTYDTGAEGIYDSQPIYDQNPYGTSAPNSRRGSVTTKLVNGAIVHDHGYGPADDYSTGEGLYGTIDDDGNANYGDDDTKTGKNEAKSMKAVKIALSRQRNEDIDELDHIALARRESREILASKPRRAVPQFDALPEQTEEEQAMGVTDHYQYNDPDTLRRNMKMSYDPMGESLYEELPEAAPVVTQRPTKKKAPKPPVGKKGKKKQDLLVEKLNQNPNSPTAKGEGAWKFIDPKKLDKKKQKKSKMKLFNK